MEVIYLILGILLVTMSIVEFGWNTLSVVGGGAISMWLARGMWGVALSLYRATGQSKFLVYSSPLLMMAVIGTWVVMLWIGFTLIFMSGDTSVLDSTTRLPVNWLDKAYFAGFSIFTLGTGDLVAGGTPWRLTSVLAAYLGLTTITLSLTYISSVITSAIAGRQLALLIHCLGNSPDEMLKTAWNGSDLSDLDHVLSEVGAELNGYAEKHLVFPIIHFFHSDEPDGSIALACARLDDSIRAIELGIDKAYQPNRILLISARKALTKYLERSRNRYRGEQSDEPTIPRFEESRIAGVPLLPSPKLDQIFHDAIERRRELSELVRGSGYQGDNWVAAK